MPTTYHLPPTTYHLPPTTHFSPPTTHHPHHPLLATADYYYSLAYHPPLAGRTWRTSPLRKTSCRVSASPSTARTTAPSYRYSGYTYHGHAYSGYLTMLYSLLLHLLRLTCHSYTCYGHTYYGCTYHGHTYHGHTYHGYTTMAARLHLRLGHRRGHHCGERARVTAGGLQPRQHAAREGQPSTHQYARK